MAHSHQNITIVRWFYDFRENIHAELLDIKSEIQKQPPSYTIVIQLQSFS